MRKTLILATALFVSLMAKAQQPQINNDKAFEISKNLEIFSDVYKNLHLNYVDDLESGKLMTFFVEPHQTNAFLTVVQANFTRGVKPRNAKRSACHVVTGILSRKSGKSKRER